MSLLAALIIVFIILLLEGGICYWFSRRGELALESIMKEDPMIVELAKAPEITIAPRSRAEISPEVYQDLVNNLRAAQAAVQLLRGSIPCYLSAPATQAASLEKYLTLMQGAVGSIDIVRVDADPA